MHSQRLFVAIALGCSCAAPSFAAGCLGLPKAEQQQCMDRIIAKTAKTPEQRAQEQARSEEAMAALQADVARMRERDQIKRQIEAEQARRYQLQERARQQQEFERQQQAIAAAEQRRRDAIAERTLRELEEINQRVQQPQPRRTINCIDQGAGFFVCN